MDFEGLIRSPATLVLLAINLLLSFSALQNPAVMDRLGFDVGRIRRNNEWYRWVTSGFVHVGPLHLLINMWALVSFGTAFELGLGMVPFLGIYFASLIGGSALTWLEHFRDPMYRAAGASGALSGLTVAYAIFAPVQQIIFIVFPMPAFVFALCFIAISAWASSSKVGDGIGHSAHLGGALAGAAIVCLWWPEAPQRMIDLIVGSVQGL